MGASLLAVLVVSVLLAARGPALRRVRAAGAGGRGPGGEPDPRLQATSSSTPSWCCTSCCRRCCGRRAWRAATSALRRNIRPIGLLAVGLPLATTFAVGFVAYKTVPELTVAAALTLGAIVAPPDAVSATAIGRRLGLPRRVMTLLGGESLLNDATALTAYKVALAAAIGTRRDAGAEGLGTFALAAGGGVVIGIALGCRHRLHPVAARRSAGGERARAWSRRSSSISPPRRSHGSGVLAVVVAALILGQRSTHAGYATRLQDNAVWKAVQLVLESFAFLMIGLQLPTVVGELTGISASVIAISSVAVFATVIVRPDRLGVPVRLPAADAVQARSGSANPHRRPRRCSSSRGQACAGWCRWRRRSAFR